MSIQQLTGKTIPKCCSSLLSSNINIRPSFVSLYIISSALQRRHLYIKNNNLQSRFIIPVSFQSYFAVLICIVIRKTFRVNGSYMSPLQNWTIVDDVYWAANKKPQDHKIRGSQIRLKTFARRHCPQFVHIYKQIFELLLKFQMRRNVE